MNSQPVVEVLYSDDQGVIFQTSSGSSPDWHTIGYDPYDGWCCTCEQYHFRKGYCRHMKACAAYAADNGIVIDDTHVYNERIGGNMIEG